MTNLSLQCIFQIKTARLQVLMMTAVTIIRMSHNKCSNYEDRSFLLWVSQIRWHSGRNNYWKNILFLHCFLDLSHGRHCPLNSGTVQKCRWNTLEQQWYRLARLLFETKLVHPRGYIYGTSQNSSVNKVQATS